MSGAAAMNEQVAKAFKQLYFAKRTGVLNCEAASGRRAVFFRSGFVVAARSSRDEDRLGEVMIRHGRITKEQFEDASHFIKSGWKLGEILAELKVIEESEIESFVRMQLLDIACMQLITPPRRLAFSPLSGVDAFLEAPISVADIVMEAARRTPEVDGPLSLLRDDERKLGFPADPLKRFQDINLNPEEAFVLSRIDGTQTTKDIFAVSPLAEETTARVLLGLLQSEVIEPEGEPGTPIDHGEEEAGATAAGEEEQGVANHDAGQKRDPEIELEVETAYIEFPNEDHWQVLRVERGATQQSIKTAFFALASRYHPDRFRATTDPDFHEKLSFVFNRVNEAFQTLSSSSSQARYEALTSKEAQYEENSRKWSDPFSKQPRSGSRQSHDQQAETNALFARARQAFDLEDHWQSIELCRQAIEQVADRAEFYHLLGLALAKNPKWRRDAEKNLKIAASLDPWKADYLVCLGKIYLDAGLHLRARKTFEQARAVDPSVVIPGDV